MSTLEANPLPRQGEPARSLSAMIFDVLVSVKFAVTLIVLIALLCVVGTLVPQGMEVASYLQKNPAATARMESFERMGLTHLFSSAGFIVLLCLLGASVMACGWRRFLAMRRTTGFARRKAMGSMLAHISILLILTGGVVRGIWGIKGYLELREGQTLTEFQMEKGTKALPFGLHLAKFEVEGYDAPKVVEAACTNHPHETNIESILVIQWPARALSARIPVRIGHEQKLVPPGEAATLHNTFVVKVLKYIPDFFVDPTTKEPASRSEAPKNPAILVQETGPGYQHEQWLFANRTEQPHPNSGKSPLRLLYQARIPTEMKLAPSGPIKTFKSSIQVIENKQVVQSRVIEVNQPFSYKGYTFYQSGYNAQDLAWTSFQVVNDPGVPIVYAGFILMVAGLFLVFYLNPWLAAGRDKASASTSNSASNTNPELVPKAESGLNLGTETNIKTEPI